MKFFLSDLHFGHKNIIEFERHQFATIQEHDEYLMKMLNNLAGKVKDTDEVYVLGDWGDTGYLYLMDMFSCKTIFLYGNHDYEDDYSKFEQYFDEVHKYPFFISKKIVLSHEPVAVYDDTVNVHGHLHGSVLQDDNHYCVSVHVIQYKPVSDRAVLNRFSKLPKYTRRFLWEPYADKYRFTQPKDEVIKDKRGNIDLSATRAYWAVAGKKNARDWRKDD